MTREQALEKARKILKAAGLGGLARLRCENQIAAALLDAYADGLGAAGDDLRLRDVDDVRAEAAALRGTT